MFRRCLCALAALAAIALSLAGCGGEDPVSPQETTRLIDTTLVIGAEGGELRTVIKPRSSWKASLSTGGEWCSFNPASGGSGGATIVIKVEENSDLATRTARIDITSKSGNGTVTILQKQIDVLDITVDDSCSFGPEGGSFTAKLEYNVDYSIACGADWVRNVSTKALQSGTAYFEVDKNASGQERSCTIAFTGAGITRTVTVSQQSAEFSVTPQQFCLDAAGGIAKATATGNVSYSVAALGADWATIGSSPSAGEDGVPTTTAVSVAVAENPEFFNRECTVPLGNPDYNVGDTLRIFQKGIDILSHRFVPFEYGPAGGEFSFDLPPEGSFSFVGSDWIEVVTYEDLPLRRTLRVGRNTSEEERTGSVTASDGSRENTLEFAQVAARITPGTLQIKFGTAGGTDTVQVTANVPYSLVRPQDAPWCTVDSLPEGLYAISAAANPGESSRSCTLGFNDGEFGANAAIEIIQAQKDVFTVSPDSLSFSPEGGVAKVTIHANVAYEFDSGEAASWIEESGREGEMRTYTVALNATGTDRTGTLTFTAGSEVRTVTITQSGAFIRAAQSGLYPGPEAGSGTVAVESNVPCSVTTTAEWLVAGISGGLVTWSATAYSGWDSRSAGIIISSPRYGAADTIKVVQGPPSQIEISQKEFSLTPAGGTVTLHVKSNKEYTYRIDGAPEWISETSPLTFAVTRNNSGQGRSCDIIFEQDGARQRVNIAQDAAYINLSATEVALPAAGGTFSLSVSGNVAFSLQSVDADWVGVQSAGSGTYTVNVQPHTVAKERECLITFKADGYDCSATARIVQEKLEMFSISPTEIALGGEASEFKINLATNLEYSYSIGPDWISDLGGLRFAAAENMGKAPRSGEIVFTAGGKSYTVTVTQPNLEILEVSPAEVSLGPDREEFAVEVASNLDCRHSISGSWISDLGGGKFAAERNSGGEDRAGSITYSAGSKSITVNVSQSAPHAAVSLSSIAFGVDGGARSVAFESNIPLTAEVSAGASWLSCAGPANNAYTISAQKNTAESPRSATVTLSNATFGFSHTIEVTQHQVDVFEVSPTEFSFGPAQEEFEVSVKSNMDYSHSISGSWISDLGGGKFAVERNSGGEDRTGSITYSAGSKSITVNVSQSAPRVSIDPSGDIAFPTEGGTQSLTAESTIPLSVSCEGGSWLSCTAADGGTYAVTAEENAQESPRSGNITFSNDDFGYSLTIKVTQAQKDVFTVSPSEFRFGPKSQTFEVNVHSNIDYTCTTSDSWIFSYGSGKFSVSAFTGSEDRAGSITYTAAGNTYSIPVSQEAPRLSLEQHSFELDSLGGDLQIKLDSNIDYIGHLLDVCEWVTFGNTTDSTLTVSVAENATIWPRSCRLAVSGLTFDLEDTLQISQTGIVDRFPFVLEQSEFAIGPDIDTVVMVHSECSDVAVSIANGSWLTPVEELATSTRKVFVCGPNTSGVNRTATVTLLGHEKKVKATVTQATPTLSMTYDSRNIPAAGLSYTSEVSANFRYNLSLSEDWVTAAVSDDCSKIDFSVAENTTGAERKCTIVISNERVGFSRDIVLTQLANRYITLTPENIAAPAAGGDYAVTVATNVSSECTALSLSDWLSVAKQQDGSWTVTVAANTSTSSRSGNIYFSCSGVQATLPVKQEGYRNPDYYYSSDYSQNGAVVSLQKASEGEGIPLFLMGDAYSDRLIADGTYAADMEKAVEAIFAVEPYKSMRGMFDISYINIVSLNEVYADDATTALGTSFVSGTTVTGNHTLVRSQLLPLLSSEEIKRAMIVVLMNQATYAGTTYLYYYDDDDSDFAPGEAIAYIPLCRGDEEFAGVVQHEVGGHGLGKLADEYFYDSKGEMPVSDISIYKNRQQSGFFRNVDFTGDSTAVRWSRFISDERYLYDGVGTFEGACGYPTGVYRPTDCSKMRLNSYQFNAPSREAIYYRLHKLAYGSDWSYDFEEFATYDAVNRRSSPAASQASLRSRKGSGAEALPPPVLLPVR